MDEPKAEVCTTRQVSAINNVALPKLWKGPLPEYIGRELGRLWDNWVRDGRYVLRNTDDRTTLVSNKIIPRETLIAVHKDVNRFLQGELAKLAKGSKVPTQDNFPSLVLPDHSGKVTNDMVTEIISRVGVELEGGWENRPHLPTKADGSVRVAANFLGEIAMPAYSPLEFPWEEDKVGFYANYPTAVNETCGMHVHVSFKHPVMYASLVTKEFTDWLLNGLEHWGRQHSIKNKHFYTRIKGTNNYCQRQYQGGYQLLVRDPGPATANRYCAVNYCIRQHGTVEIRVLPMFKAKEISRKAIIEVIRLICLWVDSQAPKARKAVLLAATEYDTRELPKELIFPANPARDASADWINLTPTALRRAITQAFIVISDSVRAELNIQLREISGSDWQLCGPTHDYCGNRYGPAEFRRHGCYSCVSKLRDFPQLWPLLQTAAAVANSPQS